VLLEFLAQGTTTQTQSLGGFALIEIGVFQGSFQQGLFDFVQDQLIQASRIMTVEAREVRLDADSDMIGKRRRTAGTAFDCFCFHLGNSSNKDIKRLIDRSQLLLGMLGEIDGLFVFGRQCAEAREVPRDVFARYSNTGERAVKIV